MNYRLSQSLVSVRSLTPWQRCPRSETRGSGYWEVSMFSRAVRSWKPDAAMPPLMLTSMPWSGRAGGLSESIRPRHSSKPPEAEASNRGPAHATYETGDIRALPCKDAEFDAVFCDKVLIHAGPASAALREMARVTRPGGRVGAIEWLPFFAISATDLAALAAFNTIFQKAVYEYYVSANLARHFHAAGLENIRTSAFLAHTTSLDEPPFWRAFIVHQMPMFLQAGLIDEPQARAFLKDIEALNAAGEFNASFTVQAATGTKSLA
jgi:SAM-dependent methyltransferase